MGEILECLSNCPMDFPKAATPQLRAAVRSIYLTRITEEDLEAQHRDSHREIKRANASKLPWLSATSTLKQNEDLYHQECGTVEGRATFRKEWELWKSVLRPTSNARSVRRF